MEKAAGPEKIYTVPVMKAGLTSILVTGDADRNKVQTLPGGNTATIEIKLPADWDARMAELGFVSQAEAAAAMAVPMHASPHEPPVEVEAPYVAEMVRQEMISRYGEDVLNQGYKVYTTVDGPLQTAANTAVRDGLHLCL